jgi:cystinosin
LEIYTSSSTEEDDNGWRIASIIVGWMYFWCWSLSFFPQAIENYNRKSVAGFSIEFALLNPSGFFFYLFYSTGGRVDDMLGTGSIRINDLCFAMLAFSMSSV